MNSAIVSSPVVFGNGHGEEAIVIQLDVTGQLSAFAVRTGNERWSYQYGQNFNTRNGGQPIVDKDGQIILGTPATDVRVLPALCF